MAKKNESIPILSFRIGEQLYALRVSDVLEVAAMVELIHVPQPIPELLGLVNRAGEVVPLLDMRVMLGAPARAVTANTFFIVAERQVGEEQVVRVGLVVDQIFQVKYVAREALQRISGNPFVQFIVNDGNDMIQMMELDPILARYIAQIES
jgi:purine-binding chemotaxis protein CheW